MKKFKTSISAFAAATSVLLMVVALAGQADAAPVKAADIVFKNAKIHTMDKAKPTAEAIVKLGSTPPSKDTYLDGYNLEGFYGIVKCLSK